MDNAVEDFKKLEDIGDNKMKTISRMSRQGAIFVDFFTMVKRLETDGSKGINFYDLWENKTQYSKKKFIQSLIAYYRKKGGNETEIQIWIRIFNLYFGAINIFKPIVAMDIYYRFKPTSILDMTMGWGGRLVGACALNVPYYTGIDLNKSLEKPYKDMVEVLNKYSTTKITLMFKSALDVDYSKLKYDLVLTSPPYYNIEKYEGQPIMDKDKWDNDFYKPLFEKSWKYLQKGGHYCLNIPAEVYDRIAVKVMGRANQFIPMPKSKRTTGEKYKEFIYVWKK